MEAGRLDRLITIQRNTPTQSESGEPEDAWTTIASRRPASMWPVRGDERFSAPEISAQEQIEFRIRYSSSVAALSPRDRVIYPALSGDSPEEQPAQRQIHDILAVHEIDRRVGLRIITTRRPDVLT